MRIKVLLGAAALLLLAGCTTTTNLSSAGSQVRFVENQPGSDCQLLGQVAGTQSNWLSGVNNESVLCAVLLTIYVIKQQQWAVMSFLVQQAQVKPFFLVSYP